MVLSDSIHVTERWPATMYLSGSKWSMRKKRRKRNPWRIIFLLMIIVLVLYFQRVIVPTIPPPFIPTLTPTRSPASFVLEAESLFEGGKLGLAEEAYREAILIEPTEPQFHLDLARVQVFHEKLEEAEINARNALLLDPNLAKAHAVLAWVLDFKGGEDTLAARESIERAIELDANSALVRAYYAEILMDQGEYEEALEQARNAVQLDPNLLEAQRALGYVWERTANYERALESYQSALRINPNLTILHISAGDMYQALEFYNDARESYLYAVGLDPENTVPLTRIVNIYARDGQYGIASQYAADAARKDPENAYLHGNLGRMYYKNFQYPEAVQSLALAIHGGQTEDGVIVEGLPLDPGSTTVVEFYSTYGLALAKIDNCDLAVQIFEALLIGVPDDEIAVFNATEGLSICSEDPVEATLEPTPTAE